MEVRRRRRGWRERTLGGAVPRRPSRLYTCVSSTTSTTFSTATPRTVSNTLAHQLLPSAPVDPCSRILRTRRRGKQPARMVQALQPLIQLTVPPLVLALCTEYLTSRTAAAAGHGHGYDRRADTRNMACIRVLPRFPVVLPHRLDSVKADSAAARVVHAHTAPVFAPHRYVSSNPSTSQLSPGPYA